MTHRNLYILSGIASLMLSVAGANAASLAGIKGAVMVNSGTGFQAVVGSVDLKPGDRVMAGPGGSAQVMHSDGCNQTVQAGTVVTVGPQSPCAAEKNYNQNQQQAQAGQQQQPQSGQQPPGGSGGTPGGGPTGLEGGALGSSTLIVGSVVVVGGVGLAVAMSGNKSSKPASP